MHRPHRRKEHTDDKTGIGVEEGYPLASLFGRQHVSRHRVNMRHKSEELFPSMDRMYRNEWKMEIPLTMT